MSLTQKRLLSLGIAIQRRADIDLRRPRIYTNDFARLFGLSGNSIHKTIADASKGLLALKVFIDLGEGSFRGYNWVTEAAYIGQRKSEVNLAYTEFAFNSALKEFLLNLEGHFQSYALHDTSSLTRVSSWRFYEILLADTFGFARARLRVSDDVENSNISLVYPTCPGETSAGSFSNRLQPITPKRMVSFGNTTASTRDARSWRSIF